MPTVQYSFLREIKKLDIIHRKGIRIYTGAFRTSPVESLHVKAFDLPLELSRNKLQLRFLYKKEATLPIQNS